jgi:hypothetical protein
MRAGLAALLIEQAGGEVWLFWSEIETVAQRLAIFERAAVITPEMA